VVKLGFDSARTKVAEEGNAEQWLLATKSKAGRQAEGAQAEGVQAEVFGILNHELRPSA
jgi:hypothetical protein